MKEGPPPFLHSSRSLCSPSPPPLLPFVSYRVTGLKPATFKYFIPPPLKHTPSSTPTSEGGQHFFCVISVWVGGCVGMCVCVGMFGCVPVCVSWCVCAPVFVSVHVYVRVRVCEGGQPASSSGQNPPFSFQAGPARLLAGASAIKQVDRGLRQKWRGRV